MTKIYQNIKGGKNGNCLQAAVASFFSLPLENVPHFVLQGEKWPDHLRGYLTTLGYQIHSYKQGLPPSDGTYYLAFQGTEVFCHAIIWKDGTIAHDPFGLPNDQLPILGYYIITNLKK